MSSLESPPLYEAIATPLKPEDAKKVPTLIAGFTWLKWFQDLWAELLRVPKRAAWVTLTLQQASISVTPIPVSALAAGVYRVSYRFRVTRAGGVSSSLQVTLAWTEGGVALTSIGAAEVGNTTATKQSGSILIHPSASTAISYSTTYANGGGTAMQYNLDVILEQLTGDQV